MLLTPLGILQSPALRAKTLNKQVLIVRIAMGHAPGDVLCVAEVRCPGHTRYRVTTHTERRTGKVDLIVHVRGVEGTMRIPGHQGEPRGCAYAGDDPGVAATVHLTEPIELGSYRREFVQAV